MEHHRLRDEANWIRVGAICQSILAPHMKKGKKPPEVQAWNPYSKARTAASLTADELREILASDRVRRIQERHRKHFNKHGKNSGGTGTDH